MRLSSVRGRCYVPLFFILLATVCNAAVPAALLQSLHWRGIGPYRGGRTLAITGVPGEPEHFYFGAVNGGVFESLDAGRTWDPIFDQVGVGSIGALAVAPSNPNIVYVGTGEADMRSNIAEGAGVFKSTDAGHSWHSIGLEDSRQIGRILVNPTDPEHVLVAALGHPYGPNAMRGVFRSTDGGLHWQRTLYLDADTGAIDLASPTTQPQIVYASLWQTRRPPWHVYPPASGAGSGLYKSVDGGEHWRPLAGHGLPERVGRIGIAVAPSAPQRVYALVDAVAGGLYRSDDAGAHFTRVGTDARVWGRGWYFGGVTVDPTNPDVVYVCNTGMYRSADGGNTFAPINGSPGGDDYHQLWIDPTNPAHQAVAVDQGALITVNSGKTWSSWFNQPTAQFYHVATDQHFPYRVYGAQQDSGAAVVPSRTDSFDGIGMMDFHALIPGGEQDYLAPDPDDPNLIFGGRVDRLDLRSGQTRNVDPTLTSPAVVRSTWTVPLVFSKAPGHALYFGAQFIYRSTDHGDAWQVISPDLTRPSPATPPTLDASTIADHENPGEQRGVVYAIGPSPLDAGLLWAGTDDGLVWHSADNGAHWQDVTPTPLTAWSKISSLEASHFDPRTAFLSVDRHRLDDPAPYVYATHDGGSTWQLIVDGLADGGPVNAVNVVREDPVQRGLLYAGTERGVYVSFDEGAHWQGLQQNLPRTSVRDLEVHDADLVIATHGRSFWIMDDMAPLRSFVHDASARTRLLAPIAAVRVRPLGFTGTPLPVDEPHARNPPSGAYIDYVLEPGVVGPISVTVRDSQGAVVRVYSSEDAPMRTDAAQTRSAPAWWPEHLVLERGPGAHRWVWDLRHTPVSALQPEELSGEQDPSVWAPPGNYQIELRVNGVRADQPLTVLPDPRVTATAADYAAQYRLAMAVQGERQRVLTLQAAADALAIRLHVLSTKTSERQPRRPLAAAQASLRALTDTAATAPWPDFTGADPTSVTGLRYLEGALKRLAVMVDSADGAPTADAERGFVLLQQRVGAVQQQLAVLARQVAALAF